MTRRKWLTGLAIAILGSITLSAHATVKVACIGNSITYGYGLNDPATQSHPAQLASMLGQGYEVGNFGHSGATLLTHGHKPYVNTAEWAAAKEFAADIAVIHLGINDTDPRNWPNGRERFLGDYVALIDTLRQINPDVKIFVARLTPLTASHSRFESSTHRWRQQVQDEIGRVIDCADVFAIDFGEPFLDRRFLFSDAVHPDYIGAWLLARKAYEGITGDMGGLSLPLPYSDGMVLQRRRPILIKGSADRGTTVKVTLGDNCRETIADFDGKWDVTFHPMEAATGLEMIIETPDSTLAIKDVAIGEVWIASGQSNMEFQLYASLGGKKEIALADDPELRFLDMKPIAYTDNVQWDNEILDWVDDLGYFYPAVWERANSLNAAHFSAIAYYFGQQLRRQLGVPVGIISNAVGGSPLESWIDSQTLEDNIPGILKSWYNNDYLQPWVQQRAKKNLDKGNLWRAHPYMPGYLFGAGIRPLASYPIQGVIWYQGESNAHNPELHEQLFPLFVDSWRRQWNDPGLPFITTQLSSIDRPSWPEFRDSQRRLADSLDNTWMVVSLDYGDSLDVHPINKRPVGERMGRRALVSIYGYDTITPAGPEPTGAVTENGQLIISFNNGCGMKGRNDTPIHGFEAAGREGIFVPVQASYGGDGKIILDINRIDNPRFVRYGWQPFTRCNLVNDENLPAPSFKLTVDVPDTTVEAGRDKGVSGHQAAKTRNGIVEIGGCNFPDNTFAPDASKHFYRGIYKTLPDGTLDCRIGSLCRPAAYFATVQVDNSTLIMGGMTPQGPDDGIYMFDGQNCTTVGQLPEAIDNAAAAYCDGTVYLIGGNSNSIASKEVLYFDFTPSDTLQHINGNYIHRMYFPGQPRIQPAAVAYGSKIYIFGGYCLDTNGKPSMADTFLVYDTSKKKWKQRKLPEGIPVTAGMSATVTPQGEIVLTGGVNKEIFLNAIAGKYPNYLSHDASWYRFNDRPVAYNPSDNTWRVLEPDSKTARAGASIFYDDKGIYISGGELQPRLRTQASHTILSEKI